MLSRHHQHQPTMQLQQQQQPLGKAARVKKPFGSMSVVPYQTQTANQRANSQCLGDDTRVVILHTKNMSTRNRDLMDECTKSLEQIFNSKAVIYLMKEEDLKTERSPLRCFVVPSLNEKNIIENIHRSFERSRIYLPKAIIETKYHKAEALPVGRIIISLSMIKSKVFLVKECNTENLRSKIVKMSGTIAKRMEEASVVVTDQADRRKLSKAYKLNIPVISPDWIHRCYSQALDVSLDSMFVTAETLIQDFKIQAFHNLTFKFSSDAESKEEAKNIVTEHGGRIVFGNENSVDKPAYILSNKYACTEDHKEVNFDFLKECVKTGYFLAPIDYKFGSGGHALENEFGNGCVHEVNNPAYDIENNNDNFKMPAQPSIPSTQATKLIMNDCYSRILTNDEPQAQPTIFTQMRETQDSSYLFEQHAEPSQVLYWQDPKNSRQRMF